jgi:hypothetical protein
MPGDQDLALLTVFMLLRLVEEGELEAWRPRLCIVDSVHVSQTVVEEGELEAWRPRFGATGDMRLELLTLTGIPQDQLSCSTISRCFLQPSQTEGEIRYPYQQATVYIAWHTL